MRKFKFGDRVEVTENWPKEEYHIGRRGVVLDCREVLFQGEMAFHRYYLVRLEIGPPPLHFDTWKPENILKLVEGDK